MDYLSLSVARLSRQGDDQPVPVGNGLHPPVEVAQGSLQGSFPGPPSQSGEAVQGEAFGARVPDAPVSFKNGSDAVGAVRGWGSQALASAPKTSRAAASVVVGRPQPDISPKSSPLRRRSSPISPPFSISSFFQHPRFVFLASSSSLQIAAFPSERFPACGFLRAIRSSLRRPVAFRTHASTGAVSRHARLGDQSNQDCPCKAAGHTISGLHEREFWLPRRHRWPFQD